MLTLKDVSCSYGQIPAIWDISLEVDDGEFVALLGYNGAGKSTTLKAISGMIPVNSGRITYNGKDITKLAPHRRVAAGCSLVPEGRRLFPKMTVRETLKLGSFAARKSIRQNLEMVFSLFPVLKNREKQLAGTLSGGEQQMLAIARGIMTNPHLLILDEPTVGLAPTTVERVFDSLLKINATGVSILVAEQNFYVATKKAKRGYIMETGRVTKQGKCDDLVKDPTIREAYLGI